MIEEYIQKSWELLKEFNRITPLMIARKFKLNIAFAKKVCEAVWLKQHQEAKLAAAQLDNDGFPAQLQVKAARKNLEKFKGKKKKS